MLKNMKINPLWIGLIVIAGLAFLFFGGLGSRNRQIPSTGAGTRDEEFGRLGQIFVARDLERDGCPASPATEFSPDEPVYVGAEESDIPGGTSVFARLLYEEQPIEDTEEIVTDRDLVNTCLWFVFDPGAQGDFEPGNYEAELFVNGNPAGSVLFTVEDAGRSQGGLFGGRDNRLELGRVQSTTSVSNNGCPQDRNSQFYSDETIYIAAEESFIPAGTEIFARLLFEGQPIEDTAPIEANRDMETCFWFEFDRSSFAGGFDPGNYEAEIYANGDLVDTVEFEVQ